MSASAKDFELPTDQESVDALDLNGFTQATSQEIYQRWETCPDLKQYPYSFLEHASANSKVGTREICPTLTS